MEKVLIRWFILSDMVSSDHLRPHHHYSGPLTFWCSHQYIPGEVVQCLGCWCHGPLRRKAISSHANAYNVDIDLCFQQFFGWWLVTNQILAIAWANFDWSSLWHLPESIFHVAFAWINFPSTFLDTLMTDFLLIVFLDNQNGGIDTKIIFLCGLVPKLLGIWYFFCCAALC